MKLSHTIARALAGILVAGCASHASHASAPERVQQAEEDKERAQHEAREARVDAEKARRDAQDAAMAQHEADVKAQFAAQAAAQAERDARADRTGVAESQQVDGRGAAFALGSSDLAEDEQRKLDDVAATLRAHPSKRVVVEGYSDETGADSRLPRRRAEAVAHYLESRGVSHDRIVTTVGKWDTTVEANRRRRSHRRVEVIVQ